MSAQPVDAPPCGGRVYARAYTPDPWWTAETVRHAHEMLLRPEWDERRILCFTREEATEIMRQASEFGRRSRYVSGRKVDGDGYEPPQVIVYTWDAYERWERREKARRGRMRKDKNARQAERRRQILAEGHEVIG